MPGNRSNKRAMRCRNTSYQGIMTRQTKKQPRYWLPRGVREVGGVCLTLLYAWEPPMTSVVVASLESSARLERRVY